MPAPRSVSLADFNPRMLSLLAGILSGDETRVSLSERLKHPMTVVMETRTLALDPHKTHLFDVVVGALLLTHRRVRREGPDNPEALDEWLTQRGRSDLLQRVFAQLKTEFPGVKDWPGRFKPDRDADGLRVTARQIDYEPMKPLTGKGHEPGAVVQDPRLRIDGTERDAEWLREAIESGHYELKTLPNLPELPYVHIPVELELPGSDPLLELREEGLKDEDLSRMVNDLTRCIRRKSEVRDERLNRGKHEQSGVRLDPNRLIDAALAARTGLAPKLFRRKKPIIEPIFKPDEHLMVLNFDMNDMRRLEWQEMHREKVRRMLTGMCLTFEGLEVPSSVLGFSDHLLSLGDGRVVCLHATVRLKSFDEPFDRAFWARLNRLFDRPPAYPGTAGCFTPLAMRDTAAEFQRIRQLEEHSYRHMIFWAPRWISEDFGQFRESDFVSRCADHIDHTVRDLQRELDGTFDTLASFLTGKLKDHAQVGGYVRSVRY